MTRAFFVTGTDTGVGKTEVTAALLRTAAARGLRASGLKPVAAGCEWRGDRWLNEDVRVLREASSVPLDESIINPVALEHALAPHVAAARAGIRLDATTIAGQVRAAIGSQDVVLIEGVGGWAVPLNDRETMADVAKLLGYPVILVVGMRLGCLSHALLTAAAIRASGLGLAGWIANSAGPPMDALDENVEALERRLPALRLGTVPHLEAGCAQESFDPWLDATVLFGA